MKLAPACAGAFFFGLNPVERGGHFYVSGKILFLPINKENLLDINDNDSYY